MRSKNIDEHLRASTESAQILARAQAKRLPLERSLHEKRSQRDHAEVELGTISQQRSRRHAALSAKKDELDRLRRVFVLSEARSEFAEGTMASESRGNQRDDSRLNLARAEEALDKLERESSRADESERRREDSLRDLITRNSEQITALSGDLQQVQAVERSELSELGQQVYQLGSARIETTAERCAQRSLERERDRRLHEATINDVISSLEPWPEFQQDIKEKYAPTPEFEDNATRLFDLRVQLLELLKDKGIPRAVIDQVFAVQEGYFQAYPGAIDGVQTTLRLARDRHVFEQTRGRRA